MGILQIPITPYSHEENSLIERSHGETLKHLRALVYERLTGKDWRRYLPIVQRVINAQYLPAIGCTATQMLFGNAIDTNQGLFLDFSKAEQKEMNTSKYMTDLLREQAILIKKSQSLIKAHADEHVLEAGAVTEFAAQSYVLLRYPPGPNRSSMPPTKLHTNTRGPYKVLRHEKEAYFLLDIVRNKPRARAVHVSRLVPFVHNPLHTSPQDVARRDLEDFYVHEVLDHRWLTAAAAQKKNKGQMEFLVSWLGYSSDWNSWEPWSAMRAVKALHRYLDRSALAYIIPNEFRRPNYDVESDESDQELDDV
jgi:hypothetical protein